MPAALVTGAASGIGRATAERLLADGFDVLSADLNPGPGTSYEADLTTREGNAGAVRAALDAFGRLDVVVANAGVLSWNRLWEMSEEQWDTVIDVNRNGTWRTIRAAVPTMIDAGNGGSIIIVSSAAVSRQLRSTAITRRQSMDWWG
jgi:NAD(P)-dependent dehydrogenase (short-subunit alcohol dehydrogenase family)